MKSSHHDSFARNLIRLGILALAVSIAATGCTSKKSTNPGDGGNVDTTQGPKTWQVSASGISFSPASLTIHVGDTVKWTSTGTHSVTSGTDLSDPQAGELFDQTLSAGQTFTHVFSSVGVIHYYCKFHVGSGMKGTITVAAATQ